MSTRRPALLPVIAMLLLATSFVWSSDKNSGGAVSESLRPFVESGVLAGAVVLVANKDEILTTEAIGYSDVIARKPIKTDDVFWIASMTKPITGAALMILVDEGKISLDDPVEKYLPEFKNVMLQAEQDKDKTVLKKPSRAFTITEVMNHTSGMPMFSKIEKKIDSWTLRESVVSYAYTPLLTEPGTKYQYSNVGINIGGMIIQVVSGMPYEEFLEERLFKPLSMKETTFWPSEGQMKKLVNVYKPTADKKGLEELKETYMRKPYSDRTRGVCPGGGLFSTAKDVAHFGQMVLNRGTFKGKRILSEDAVKVMTSHTTGDLPQSYGIGFSTEKKPDGSFGHGGAYGTDLRIDPVSGLVTVYMIQHAGFAEPGGGKILEAFKKAAKETYAK